MRTTAIEPLVDYLNKPIETLLGPDLLTWQLMKYLGGCDESVARPREGAFLEGMLHLISKGIDPIQGEAEFGPPSIEAQKAAEAFLNWHNDNEGLIIRQCPSCGKWHTTRQWNQKFCNKNYCKNVQLQKASLILEPAIRRNANR
jgi:hypothetical protein